MNEYEHEPIRGLPAMLPEGETILWQGAPAWGAFAKGALHVRVVALYFAALAVWRAVAVAADGEGLMRAATSAALLVALGAVAVSLLVGFAWLVARTTVYTITTRRVMMRFGIALPMTVNVPFKIVGAASLDKRADGTGNIPLSLTGRDRIAYLILWPHVRPWRFAKSEPMLRFVPEAAKVAEILGRAAAAATVGQAATPRIADEAGAPGIWPHATAAA